jgi:tetratricopeptide (TPR) repeat protein
MKNIGLYIGGIVLVALLVAAVPVAEASSAATEQLLSKARSLEGRGRLDLAARAWEQTLLADPNNAEALLGLAKFAKQNGNAEEANRYLEKLRNLDPKNPAIGNVEGMASAGKQHSLLEEAGRLAASQNFDAAMRIYRGLFGNEPPPGDVAVGYYETLASTPGGWKDAVAGLQRLTDKYPQSELYRLSLGRLKTYREPSRIEGMEILAGVKGAPQSVNMARAAWRQALVWSAGGATSLPSLQAYLSRYPDPELQKLMLPASKTPEAPQPKQFAVDNSESGLGYSFLNAQKFADAEKHFQAALKTTPHNPIPLAGMGYLKVKQEDFHGAIDFFQQALEFQPKNKSVTEALANARFWEQMKAGGEAANEHRSDVAVGHFEKALAMRPASAQAADSLANSYMAQQRPALAMPLYEKLVQLKPQSLDYWYGLVKAKYQSGGAADALTELKNAPPLVKDEWAKNPEHLALLSSIYASVGELDQSKQLFERALVGASSNNTELPVYQQLEFAGLSLRMGRAKQAAAAFLQIAAKHPANVDAWTGSIGALLQIPDSARAYNVLQRIPQNTFAVALTRTDFLRSVAKLQTSMKRYDLAEKSLSEVSRIDNAEGRKPTLDSQLQIAELNVQLRRTERAEKLFRAILEEYPNNKSAWVSLVALLHQAKADTEAIAEIEKMPEDVALESQNDAGFVSLEASVYAGAGRKERALSLVRDAQRHFEGLASGVPVSLDIQSAWLLLDDPESQTELAKVLERDNTRSDLTETERHDLNQLWSVWSQRRAQAAIEAQDNPKAISILQAAAVVLPHDPRIQAMIATTFLRAQNFQKAFEVYQRWDLKDAQADDFRGAVGAASAANEEKFAAKWLDRGLRAYPGNPRLLQLAGEQAAQQRDYKLADSYFRQALARLSSEATARAQERPDLEKSNRAHQIKQTYGVLASSLLDPPAAGGRPRDVLSSDQGDPTAVPGPGVGLADLSGSQPNPIVKPPLNSPLDRSGGKQEISPTSTDSYSSGARSSRVSSPATPSVLEASQADDPTMDPAPFLFNRAFAPGKDTNSETSERHLAQPAAPATDIPNAVDRLELRGEIESDLEAVDGRNTPYFQNGVNLQQRTGQGGFDKLLIEEAHLEASTTVANRVRLTIIATPTYLDSGSPALPATDGNLGFGSTGVGGVPGVRSAFGIGGEAQLATTDFGLRLGLTPEEFLVHGWVGGLRWNPASGPFTILLNRDPIRDTMLSFAGERDPTSQQVWGGVMANTASIIGNHSHGNTGFYGKLDYQDIEGKEVAKNNRIEANVGSYFKVYRTNLGELTIGLNLTGFHYDKNLRYFTLGQGGYFSPQEYFLFNVPAQWTGTLNRKLQYSISASLGVQHFTEDASPYFPTDTARQAASGLSYPSYTNTSGNYNLSFRSIYQIAPQWLGGFFFDVNNAREYRAVNAGLYLKFLLDPRPTPADLTLTPVPDWTGVSPFDVSGVNRAR